MCDVTLLGTYLMHLCYTEDMCRKPERESSAPGGYAEIWEEGIYQDAMKGRRSDREWGGLNPSQLHF